MFKLSYNSGVKEDDLKLKNAQAMKDIARNFFGDRIDYQNRS